MVLNGKGKNEARLFIVSYMFWQTYYYHIHVNFVWHKSVTTINICFCPTLNSIKYVQYSPVRWPIDQTNLFFVQNRLSGSLNGTTLFIGNCTACFVCTHFRFTIIKFTFINFRIFLLYISTITLKFWPEHKCQSDLIDPIIYVFN